MTPIRSILARLKPLGAMPLALLLAAAPLAAPLASAGAPARPALKAGVFSPPYMAPELALPGTGGSDVALARYRGKVVLVTFGFTHCAAVCPTTLATLAQARESLGKSADAVQVIYVTVDPERDGLAHMRKYLAAFDDSFVGVTGAPAALADVRRKYGVTAAKHGSGRDYVMSHTSSIFMIDRAGKLRAVMPYGRDPADYVHDLKLLLAQ